MLRGSLSNGAGPRHEPWPGRSAQNGQVDRATFGQITEGDFFTGQPVDLSDIQLPSPLRKQSVMDGNESFRCKPPHEINTLLHRAPGSVDRKCDDINRTRVDVQCISRMEERYFSRYENLEPGVADPGDVLMDHGVGAEMSFHLGVAESPRLTRRKLFDIELVLTKLGRSLRVGQELRIRIPSEQLREAFLIQMIWMLMGHQHGIKVGELFETGCEGPRIYQNALIRYLHEQA